MNDIAPRFTVEGTAHRVTKRTLPASEDGSRPARTVANVIVLTSGGGFAEIEFDEANLASCPAVGQVICWYADVDLRRYKSQDGSWRAVLRVRFVEDRLTADATVDLHAVNA